MTEEPAAGGVDPVFGYPVAQLTKTSADGAGKGAGRFVLLGCRPVGKAPGNRTRIRRGAMVAAAPVVLGRGPGVTRHARSSMEAARD